MLPPIDQVQWDKLHSWYEKSSEIPAAIKALKENPSEKIAIRSCDFLSEELEHQDGVCEAAAFAMPYLVELLNEPCPIVTPRVLVLMASCYHGAIFGANECDFRVGEDTVDNPQQYREKKISEGSYGDGCYGDDRKEVFGCCVLIYNDLQNARGAIEELSNSKHPEIANAASDFLPVIDDYWANIADYNWGKTANAANLKAQDDRCSGPDLQSMQKQFEEPSDGKLINFLTEFTAKFNNDFTTAFEQHAYWDGLSDEEKTVNMNAFKDAFTSFTFCGRIQNIKTLPFSEWKSPMNHQPYIREKFYETVVTPETVLQVEAGGDETVSGYNVSVRVCLYVFDVGGKLFIGTVKDTA